MKRFAKMEEDSHSSLVFFKYVYYLGDCSVKGVNSGITVCLSSLTSWSVTSIRALLMLQLAEHGFTRVGGGGQN